MNLATIITMAVVTAVCILPFIIMGRARKKIESDLLRSLQGVAAEKGCTIAHHQMFGLQAIGMDADRNNLFYYKQTKQSPLVRHVNMNTVATCTMVNNSHQVGSGKSAYTVIDLLALQLTFGNKGIPSILIPFYDAEEDLQLNDELLVMQQWATLIDERLNELRNN